MFVNSFEYRSMLRRDPDSLVKLKPKLDSGLQTYSPHKVFIIRESLSKPDIHAFHAGNDKSDSHP